MTPRRAWTVCLAALSLASPAWAQDRLLDLLGASGAGRTQASSAGGVVALPPMTGPVDPAEYMVGPGDVLQVNLTGGVTRTWEAMVSPEGTLFVPSVGGIPVAGLSLLDARRVVTQRVSVEYRKVNVDLRLLRPRVMLVHLAGETRHNGPLEVSGASRASEVLADTLLAPRSSRRNIEVRRRTPQGEQRIPLDLLRFRLTGRLPRDPLLRDGDVLFVPVSNSHIGIEGAVGRAGQYELAAGDSLSTLFELGGGVLADATDEAILVRFRDATHMDSLGFRVSDVVAGRFDVALRDGDRAFVYYIPHFHRLEHASILGEVQRPGAYPLEPGVTRLSDMVRASGGFLETADLAALRVFRADPRSGDRDPEIERLSQLSRRDMTSSEYEVLRARITARREDFRVDWNRVKSDPDLDMLMRTGDIVRVDPSLAAVRVEGEVRRPGLVRHEANRKVSEYVRLAGGFSQRASRGQVRITRAVTGQTLLAREVSALEPGDLIWVPERGDVAVWQNTQSLLLVLAQIATVIVAVRPR